jgi:hypothetical protein
MWVPTFLFGFQDVAFSSNKAVGACKRSMFTKLSKRPSGDVVVDIVCRKAKELQIEWHNIVPLQTIGVASDQDTND